MAGRARGGRRGARRQACREPEARRRAPPRARQGPGRDDGGPSAIPWAAGGPASGPAGSRRDGEGTGVREGGDSPEGRVRVIAGSGARDGSAAGMAGRHGVSRTAPYLWHGEVMGDGGGGPEGKGGSAGEGPGDLPDGAGVSRDVPHGGDGAAREGAAAAGRPPGGLFWFNKN